MLFSLHNSQTNEASKFLKHYDIKIFSWLLYIAKAEPLNIIVKVPSSCNMGMKIKGTFVFIASVDDISLRSTGAVVNEEMWKNNELNVFIF